MYTKKQEMKWICPHCGTVQKTVIYSTVSVFEEPDCTKKILDTSLFRMKCDQCAKEEYYTGPLLYVDEREKFVIAMGEDNTYAQQMEQYLSLGFQVRTMDEIVDLCEKILIQQSHRDDRIVELMKATNAVLLKGQIYDRMLYAPDEDAVYFELIHGTKSAGRIPFLEAIYEDLQERFAQPLIQQEDEMRIDFSWAVKFFNKEYPVGSGAIHGKIQ